MPDPGKERDWWEIPSQNPDVPYEPESKYTVEYVEDYMGWGIFKRTYPAIGKVEYIGFLIEGQEKWETETQKKLHASKWYERLHQAAHVLHNDTLEGLKKEIETYGQVSRKMEDAQKFISENWFMLLLGAGYVSLLGLGMYQSYNWSDSK